MLANEETTHYFKTSQGVPQPDHTVWQTEGPFQQPEKSFGGLSEFGHSKVWKTKGPFNPFFHTL